LTPRNSPGPATTSPPESASSAVRNLPATGAWRPVMISAKDGLALRQAVVDALGDDGAPREGDSFDQTLTGLFSGSALLAALPQIVAPQTLTGSPYSINDLLG